MKKILKTSLLLSLLLVILSCLPSLVHAGIGDPGCDPLDPGCPIDGGLGLLLAAGAGYGIKKARSIQKNKDHKLQDQ